MGPVDDREAVARFPVRNDAPWPVTLVLEPWGEEMTLHGDAQVTITVRGEHAAQTELVWEDRHVTVFAAPGTTLSVEDARGVRILDIDIPFPGLPDGMSTRAFLGCVLGGEHDT